MIGSIVWAQGQPAGSPGSASASAAMALLALRRWCSGVTLASPDPFPSLMGIWWWLGGLAVLLLLAVLAQGPIRAIGQMLDPAGQARLIVAAWGRLRKAGRLLAVAVGASVLCWTADQAFSYKNDQGIADLATLTRSRGPGELALEQGAYAALTPLRDVAGLAEILPLLAVGSVLMFVAAGDVYREPGDPIRAIRASLRGRANLAAMAGALYVAYRLVGLASGSGELPPALCLVGVEVVLAPALMVLSDGLLLAWALVELRQAGPGGEPVDADGTVALLPAAALACLLALPARYLAAATWLALPYAASWFGATSQATSAARWLLGPGLAACQGAALLASGLAGAAAWGRGGVRGAIVGYGRLLRAEGGRIVGLLALAGLAAGMLSAAAYAAILALPPHPWVLAAADGYAHYATLPVGLGLLAALVELGERSLPLAELARPAAEPGTDEPAIPAAVGPLDSGSDPAF